jgi:predicted RNA-binding protein with PUA-like domain
MKNEPSVYSIDDLEHDGTYCWDGVRNYQARNLMRDEMKVGDMVLYYYSNADPSGIAGIAKIVKGAYSDPSQFNKRSEYYDLKATKEIPRWVAVDVAFVSKFATLISLQELKLDPFFSDMLVVKKGMRLSVQPVQKKHFEKLAKRKIA